MMQPPLVSLASPAGGGPAGLHVPPAGRSLPLPLAWPRTPRGDLALLIVATLLARLLFAGSLGLGVDESYVVAAGRTLHGGYFDHPPVVWWITWAATQVAGPANGFAVRLPFVLLFALSSWLMFQLGAALFGERAGLWSAVALNAAPVLGVTTGSWVLPDGPLVAALLGAAVCLVRALPDPPDAWRWWLGAGFCFGLASLSKYTAAPVALGLGIFLLTEPGGRGWLRRPHPYAAALLAAAMFAPVMVWNARHGWASLLFQGGRAESGRWHPFGPLTTLVGEALFFLPWIWLPLALCVYRAARRGPAEWRGWLLVCLSVPSVLLFEFASLRGHVLFHWAAPGTMLALPLLGELIGERREASRPLRIGIVVTAALVSLGATLVATEVRFNWLPGIGEDFALGKDPDLGAVDWTSLRAELARRDLLQPGLVIAATRWFEAGKIGFALQGEVPVVCLGNDPREYGLAAPLAAHAGEDMLIVSARDDAGAIMARFGADFDALEPLPPVVVRHAGKPAMLLTLVRAHRFHAAPAP